VGDVDPGVGSHVAGLTPVPGGVGPVTTALLLEHTVRAAEEGTS
jgi:methylenetetrahydrofolate dehydrogenase (NADP+)/methenyltetrahydrofolate cyclohydrolase